MGGLVGGWASGVPGMRHCSNSSNGKDEECGEALLQGAWVGVWVCVRG